MGLEDFDAVIGFPFPLACEITLGLEDFDVVVLTFEVEDLDAVIPPPTALLDTLDVVELAPAAGIDFMLTLELTFDLVVAITFAFAFDALAPPPPVLDKLVKVETLEALDACETGLGRPLFPPIFPPFNPSRGGEPDTVDDVEAI